MYINKQIHTKFKFTPNSNSHHIQIHATFTAKLPQTDMMILRHATLTNPKSNNKIITQNTHTHNTSRQLNIH